MNTIIDTRHRFAHIRRNANGQGLIEMALVFMLLLLIVAGAVDFGRAFNNYIIITNASREGARYASRFPADQTGIRQAAIDEAANSGIILTPSDVGINPSGTVPVGGEPIRVIVTYSFPTILGGVFGYGTLPLSTSTEMVVFGLDT